jgi:hypothetical protein
MDLITTPYKTLVLASPYYGPPACRLSVGHIQGIRNVALAPFVAVDVNNALQLALSIMAQTPGARPRSLAEPYSAFVQTTVWSTCYSTL